MNVLIIGASHKPDRYSYIANDHLKSSGHTTFLYNPFKEEILGQKVYQDLSDIPDGIDTITMYVNGERSNAIKDSILALKPRRIIFNPGSESPELKSLAEKSDILCLEACTLVMLSSGQF